MLDFSFSELLVVVIVSIITLGPQEMVQILRQLRQQYKKLQQWLQSYWQQLEIDYIQDINDNWQQAYDVDAVLQKIEEANSRQLIKQTNDQPK